jgi:transposase
MDYDQRVIIRFLMNEGVLANEIFMRLRVQFGEDSYALGTVQFWMQEIKRGRQDLRDEHRTGRPSLGNLDTQILSILEKEPFESARSIAHTLGVDHTTVLDHLQEKLGFKPYNLRWVPHLLTEDLKAKRKEISTLIIPYIENAKRDGWRHFVTGDESWF